MSAPRSGTCHHRNEAPTVAIQPVFELQHTRVSQRVAPSFAGNIDAGSRERKSCQPPTAHGMWTRPVAQTLTLLFHHWLCLLHCLPAAAQTCCAPIGDVEPVEEASRRQGDIFSAVVLPDSLNESCRSLALSARHNSTASGLFMMAFASHQHALEMNSGSPASSYWAAVVPRTTMCENLCPVLSTYRYAIATHLHSRCVGPIVGRGVCSSLALGIKRVFLVGSRRDAHRVMDIHLSCLTARPHQMP
jgi:hypothetical protein